MWVGGEGTGRVVCVSIVPALWTKLRFDSDSRDRHVAIQRTEPG